MPAGCLQPCVGLGGLARSPHFVEVRHERVRIGLRIFKRLLRQPCVVSLAHIGWKTFDVKVRELFVAGVLRRSSSMNIAM